MAEVRISEIRPALSVRLVIPESGQAIVIGPQIVRPPYTVRLDNKGSDIQLLVRHIRISGLGDQIEAVRNIPVSVEHDNIIDTFVDLQFRQGIRSRRGCIVPGNGQEIESEIIPPLYKTFR